MPKYVIGVDFGTLSARALVVDALNGRELGTAVMDYPHGVLDSRLPTGEELPPEWALQHPGDYIECLSFVIPEALRLSGVDKSEIAGVGIDFTACTLIPIDNSGAPLCLNEKWARRPHAWPTLWKHHAAQPQANRLTELANARGEEFLRYHGGKFSPEWALPKILNVLEEASDVYAAARFIDAGDWIVMRLTGVEARSASIAGYKMLWDGRYHSRDFLRAVDPRLENLISEKLSEDVREIGSRAGGLTREGALITGLNEGTSVAVANIDAQVSLPAAGAPKSGRLLMIMGTSTCHMMLYDKLVAAPGICAVVKDGMVPGYYGYEAGQSCVGDLLNWFADNFAPARYADEARGENISLHELLTRKAAALAPGQSGLLALDWVGGNRSVLADMELSGLLIGATLATKPEHIYRALIEATAFGTRVIIENYEKYGLEVTELLACGGIANKNPLMMQIYADVLGREIGIVRSKLASAVSSAMFGACAAGLHSDISEAARYMGGVSAARYVPDAKNVEIYDDLFREYAALHDFFGRGGSDAMKRLKAGRARSGTARAIAYENSYEF